MQQTAFATAATLVSLAFAMSTFEAWLERRARHQLAWTTALAMFSVASAALAIGSSAGWSGAAFRTFYLFGAILNVPFLALGTVYLLWGKRAGDITAIGLAVLAGFSIGVMAIAPFTHPLPKAELARGAEVLPVLPRVLAAVSSSVGTAVLLGGAGWSMFHRRSPGLVTGNLLILVGTLITAASGLLNSVADRMGAFSFSLCLGITVIFLGFLLATTRPNPSSTPPRHR